METGAIARTSHAGVRLEFSFEAVFEEVTMTGAGPASAPSGLHRLVMLLKDADAARGDRLHSDAMQAVSDELGAAAAWLYRVHYETLEIGGVHGLAEDLVASISKVAVGASGLVSRCATRRTPQILERSAAVDPGDRALFDRTEADVIQSTPLVAHGDLVGVLVHVTKKDAAPIPEQHVATVAAVVALTIAATTSREWSRGPNRQLVGTMHAVVEKLLEQVAWEPLRRSALFGEPPNFDEPAFLKILLEGAKVVTGAGIAAVGVGTDSTRSFDPWLFLGVSEELAKSIGHHPRPVATLGAVAIDGETICLREASEHPAFGGVPPHHPPLHSLLAVPIRIRGRSFGNLYLANKEDAPEFSAADQQVVELLASLAAMGLHFAHLAMSEHERMNILQILEATPDGVLYVDSLTGQLLVSKSFEHTYGKSFEPGGGVEQEMGITCWPDGRPLTRDELPSVCALRGKTTKDLELVLVRPDGTRVPVSQRAVPFYREGEVRGALVSVRDVSALKEVQRVREEFAAMVVHDLRNPIQAMLLQIEALRTASEEGRSLASTAWDRLARSATRLSLMATDMLDSTRIELARISLNRTPTDPETAVRNVVDSIQSVLRDHPIIVAAPVGLPRAMIDVVRFDQVLTNLLENAAKHSEEGRPIHVELRTLNGGVEIAIRDEGVGISPEELPRLFDRFYQAKRARAHRTGLGLGLHIAKGLVEAHGGNISAESVIDRGSIFRVWLPSMESELAQPPASH